MRRAVPLLAAVFLAASVDAFASIAAAPRPLSRKSVPRAVLPQLSGVVHWDPLGLETAAVKTDDRPHVHGGALAVSPAAEDDSEELLLVIAALMLVSGFAELLHAGPAAAAAGGSMPAGAVALTSQQIFEKAAKKALGGGVSGAIAGVFQVLLLMWLRTTMNYQYRNGGGTREAMAALYAEGGLRRFYRGVSFALFQTPLSRFGDTAANSGVLALLATSDLPVGVKTAAASGAASLWRITLTPVDTMKTSLQVVGEGAFEQVKAKVKTDGFGALYQGALGNALASFAGNYPWFLTFNSLNEALPAAPDGDLAAKLLRTAALGVSAACVSDCVSNSIRVLKTTRQTSAETISYQQAARSIIETDGWQGLFGRGLSTRLATNALQAVLFTVIWKLLEEQISRSGFFS